jgi:hypothetical protein
MVDSTDSIIRSARGNYSRRGRGVTEVRHLLEVARFKRSKAYCLLRDASSMSDAQDRAHLVLCAKFFEEEAVKLEERAGEIYGSGPARLHVVSEHNRKVA